jgi:hypothetical protein
MPQISPSSAKVPVDGAARPASRADTDLETVAPAPDTVPNSLPAESAATDAARTQSAHLFLLLALALGAAAALLALVSKMAGLTRESRPSDHPDHAWRSYRAANQRPDEAFIHQHDAPFLAPQEPHEPADLDAQEWIEQSPLAQADFPVAWRQDEKPGQSEQVGSTLKEHRNGAAHPAAGAPEHHPDLIPANRRGCWPIWSNIPQQSRPVAGNLSSQSSQTLSISDKR